MPVYDSVVAIRNWRKTASDRLGLVTTQQVFRAIWLGILIGTISGFGAIVFFETIALATEHLLGELTGFVPPEPLGEIGDGEFAPQDPTRLWALPLVLGFGGLAAGALVYTFAPEAEGHGTDAAIDSFHHHGGRMRWMVVPVKLVASAITIGSGGAAGREGPTAQIGGTFGSTIADRLGLGAIERRKALAAGMGAGIGAIFRAPLGGAMMASEVFYKHDFEADVILLSLISSVVAFGIYGSYYDYDPIFGATAADFTFTLSELPYYALLGVVCGGLGIVYARGFYGTVDLFKKVPAPRWVRPAIGGVIVGCIGMLIPEAIHVGYGYVQQSLTIEGVMEFSPWLLLVLPFARILTTSLSVGSGGSGGIFGPGMVIGGMTGAFVWRICQDLPGFPDQPGPVVIIAMIAMFGSIAHAPLAMMLMVGEMTGNLALLAPAMVAVAVATLLVGDNTIYESQVDTRADSTAHRHRFAFPLLNALPAQRAVAPLPVISEAQSIRAALEMLEADGTTQGVVVDGDGKITGEVSAERLRTGAEEHGSDFVTAVAEPIPAVVLADTPLDEALDMLARHERRWLPVTDGEGGEVLGAVDARALVRSYRRAVQSQVRPLTPVDADVNTMELVVLEDSPIRGMTLAEAGLPAGARVLTIARDGHVQAPVGTTVFMPGDQVTLTLTAGTRAATLELFLGN